MIEFIIVQIMGFVGLVLFLRWIFFRNVSSALRRMQLIHQHDVKQQEELKAKLKATEAEYQSKIRMAQEESKRILSAAKSQADQAREEMLKEARSESQRMIQDAHDRRDEIRKEVEEEVGQKAIQLSSDAVRYVFSTQIEQGIHQQLVDELLSEMVHWDPGEIAPSVVVVEVKSPQKLTPEQAKQLKKTLEAKAGHPLEIKESLDPSAIAGVVVHLDQLILDGSLRNKLKEAVGYVRKSRR